MSAQATSWAWGQEAPTPLAKLVLMALANRADEFGICYRGQQHLAKLCDCTVKGVQDNLERLEDAGLIRRRQRRRVNGSRTTDLYLLAPKGDRGDMERPDEKHENWAQVEDMLQGEDGSPSCSEQGEDGSPPQGEDGSPPPGQTLTEEPSEQEEERASNWPEELVAGIRQRLKAVADAKRCAPVTLTAQVRAMDAFPEVDHAAVAEDLEFWAQHGAGKQRKVRSLAGTWRTFLKKADEDRHRGRPGASVQSGGVQTPAGLDSLIRDD